MCDMERIWTPLAVCVDDEVVGFAMWAHDPEEEGSIWLGAILVDRAHQRRGIGRAAMERLVERLSAEPGCREIALSYDARATSTRRSASSRRASAPTRASVSRADSSPVRPAPTDVHARLRASTSRYAYTYSAGPPGGPESARSANARASRSSAARRSGSSATAS